MTWNRTYFQDDLKTRIMCQAQSKTSRTTDSRRRLCFAFPTRGRSLVSKKRDDCTTTVIYFKRMEEEKKQCDESCEIQFAVKTVNFSGFSWLPITSHQTHASPLLTFSQAVKAFLQRHLTFKESKVRESSEGAFLLSLRSSSFQNIIVQAKSFSSAMYPHDMTYIVN